MAGYLTLWAALLQAEAVPIYDERTEQMRMEPHANPAGAAEARRSLGACGRRPALDEVSRNFPAGVALARAARQPKGAAARAECTLCSTFEMASVPKAVSSTPVLDVRGFAPPPGAAHHADAAARVPEAERAHARAEVPSADGEAAPLPRNRLLAFGRVAARRLVGRERRRGASRSRSALVMAVSEAERRGRGVRPASDQAAPAARRSEPSPREHARTVRSRLSIRPPPPPFAGRRRGRRCGAGGSSHRLTRSRCPIS